MYKELLVGMILLILLICALITCILIADKKNNSCNIECGGLIEKKGRDGDE